MSKIETVTLNNGIKKKLDVCRVSVKDVVVAFKIT